MKLKGQSSLEFLAYVSISALILAGMYGVMASKQEQTFEYNQRENAQKIAEKTGFQVEMALVQGEGYSRSFSVPAKASGEFYNVSVGHSRIIFEKGDEENTRPTLYEGDWLNLSTKDANQYKIYNDGDLSVKPIS